MAGGGQRTSVIHGCTGEKGATATQRRHRVFDGCLNASFVAMTRQEKIDYATRVEISSRNRSESARMNASCLWVIKLLGKG